LLYSLFLLPPRVQASYRHRVTEIVNCSKDSLTLWDVHTQPDETLPVIPTLPPHRFQLHRTWLSILE
jgi:hypothetical protein